MAHGSSKVEGRSPFASRGGQPGKPHFAMGVPVRLMASMPEVTTAQVQHGPLAPSLGTTPMEQLTLG